MSQMGSNLEVPPRSANGRSRRCGVNSAGSGAESALHPMATFVADLRVKVAATMAPILTAEHVVRRIASDRPHVDERGGVGIRVEPATDDRAVTRRANPPGAGAQADAAVGESAGAIGIVVTLFVNRPLGSQHSGCARGGQLSRCWRTARSGHSWFAPAASFMTA
jgi:hypothetical protein